MLFASEVVFPERALGAGVAVAGKGPGAGVEGGGLGRGEIAEDAEEAGGVRG